MQARLFAVEIPQIYVAAVSERHVRTGYLLDNGRPFPSHMCAVKTNHLHIPKLKMPFGPKEPTRHPSCSIDIPRPYPQRPRYRTPAHSGTCTLWGQHHNHKQQVPSLPCGKTLSSVLVVALNAGSGIGTLTEARFARQAPEPGTRLCLPSRVQYTVVQSDETPVGLESEGVLLLW